MGYCFEVCAKTYAELNGAILIAGREMNNGKTSGKVGNSVWKLQEVDEVWTQEHL